MKERFKRAIEATRHKCCVFCAMDFPKDLVAKAVRDRQ